MSERMGDLEIEAVLFDLGNTLVSYYKPGGFHPILERCIAVVLPRPGARSCAGTVSWVFWTRRFSVSM
jgi:hypothetical protein